MSDDRIVAALQALARSDREKEAPAEVEAALRKAFRQRQGRGRAPWIVAAAVVIAAFVGFRTKPVPDVKSHDRKEVVPPLPVEPLPVAVKPARKPVRIREARPREIVTEFFPLMDTAPPFERGELIRVSLPAAAMQTVGLPVREERLAEPVQADVLVGEDGLARAIRFVKFEQ